MSSVWHTGGELTPHDATKKREEKRAGIHIVHTTSVASAIVIVRNELGTHTQVARSESPDSEDSPLGKPILSNFLICLMTRKCPPTALHCKI